MMKKNHVNVSILLLITFLMLSACGKSKDEQRTTSNASNLTQLGEFPIVNEKETISILVGRPASVEDLETNSFTKWYEDKTNVNIEWTQVPEVDVKEKVNILLASGEFPDVLMNAKIGKDQLTLYGEQGVFLPLNQYIEDNSVHLKKLFEDNPEIQKIATALDGNLYSIPKPSQVYHATAPVKMWIYKPWLEKLKIDMPSTTEEFYNVLRAFKKDDPNGNGEADEIPLAGSTKGWFTDVRAFIMNSFTYHPSLERDEKYIALENDKVYLVAEKEGWREGLRYLRRLYQEGLITSESFVQDQKQLRQLGENPEVPILGAVPGGAHSLFTESYGKSGRYYEYVTVPPLKGPTGLQQATTCNETEVVHHMVITNKCKNPELVVRWADWFYSFEGSIQGHRGLEGIGIEWANENEKSYTGEKAVYKEIRALGIQNDRWYAVAPGFHSSRIRESSIEIVPDGNPAHGAEYILWYETKTNYEPYKIKKENVLPDLFYSPEITTELAHIKLNISEYIDTSAIKFIVGDLDLEQDWDDYLKNLNDLNVKRYIELIQQTYDKNMNK